MRKHSWWLTLDGAKSHMEERLFLQSLISCGRSVAAISPESPADGEGSIEAVRAGSAKIGRAEPTAVTSQVVHLMLGKPQLKISRQLKCRPYRAIIGHRLHRGLVTELGDVAPEAEPRLEEKKEMPSRGAGQGLDLQISAEDVARVGRALRSSSTGAGRLRKHAAAEIRLIVRWCHGEIRIAADPVSWEKSGRL